MNPVSPGGDPAGLTAVEALERLLRAYGDYYNIERTRPAPPFAAEAVFHSHEEQFFLVRSARIAEAESNEYVFFATEHHLTPDRLRELDRAAWRIGTERVSPHRDHRSSDVILIVLADSVDPEAMALVSKCRHYQSYRWGFQGWSHFLLFLVETSTLRCGWNRQGQRLRKLIRENLSTGPV